MPSNVIETLNEFIDRVETAHFRTDCDTGANENALFIWNMVRGHAGKPRLRKTDMRTYCAICKEYHFRPLCTPTPQSEVQEQER